MFGPVISNTKLRDTAGNEFSVGGSQINPPDEESGAISTIINYYPQAILRDSQTDEVIVDNDYFRNQYDTLPTEIALQLELNIADPATFYGSLPAGNGQDTPEPAFEPMGPFIFEFELPLPAPLELVPALDVELHNLTMRLETLEVTPAFAEGRFCMELPDAGDWQPQATITVNGAAGAMSGAGITGMDQLANTEQRCFDLRFHVPHYGTVEAVTVSLDAIEKSMSEGPEEWNRIQQVLAEQGIEMIVNAVDHGITLEMPNLPDDMTYQDAINLARQQLGDRITGPWVFNVELP